MGKKTIAWLVLGLFLYVLVLLWVAVLDEIVYYKTSKYALYTIQVELLNKSTDTLVTRQPVGIHFQVNCHSHKGEFKGCNLEAVPTDVDFPLFFGGHWFVIRHGVMNFRVLKTIEEK